MAKPPLPRPVEDRPEPPKITATRNPHELTEFVDHIFDTGALIARRCIEGGMHPEDAWTQGIAFIESWGNAHFDIAGSWS